LPRAGNSGSIAGMSKEFSSRCWTAAAALVALTVWLPAHAQEGTPQTEQPPPQTPRRLFVSDKLVLNVYTEPDQGGSRVATIETGDGVEEVERAERFVRIRLDDGREGWVGASYLTAETPATVRLRELQREQKAPAQADKKAADEIARWKSAATALQTRVGELQAALTRANEIANAPKEEEPPGGSAAGIAAVTAAVPASGWSWIWPLAVALAAGLGFAAGHQTIARKIRKKFGGLKIY
jgi:uncharacterized protein YgiM (DUF1202 family)